MLKAHSFRYFSSEFTVRGFLKRLCSYRKGQWKIAGIKLQTKRFLRNSVTLVLIVILLTSSLSPAIASATIHEAVIRSTEESNHVWMTLAGWLKSKGSVQGQSNHNGIKPGPPQSKAQREDRAARLEMNPSTEVVLQSHQPMLFTAIPLDKEGTPVNGLQAEWESSDKQIIFVKKNGPAIVGKPGSATLMAKAGKLKETIKVTVVEGTGKGLAGRRNRIRQEAHVAART